MSLLAMARTLGTRALDLWLSVQAELHGHYSAQQLVALHASMSRFRFARLWAVLLLVPWPCLVTIVLLDFIPLDDPSLGTDRNVALWIRSTIFSGILAVACIILFLRSVPMIRIPLLTIATTAVVVAVGSSLSGYGLSLAIGFPLPLSLVLETPAWSILMALCLGSATPKQLKENASAKALLTEWLDIAGVQNSTLFVYSLYSYMFMNLSDSAVAQTALFIVMQVTKMVFKYTVNRKISQYPDIKAEVVILNVEISHALFAAFSMQNTTSVVTLIVLAVVDFLHGIATYYEVKHAISAVERLESEMNELQAAPRDAGSALQYVHGDRGTVTNKAAAILAKRAPTFRRGVCGSRQKVAVLPTKPVQPSSSGPRRLKVVPHRVFDSMMVIAPSPAPLLTSTNAWRQVDRNLETFSRQSSNAGKVRTISLVQLEEVYVERVLALLHMTDFAVLTEFVEFVVPMIYVMYVAALGFLPNSTYYPQQVALSASSSSANASDTTPHSNLSSTLLRTLTCSLLELVLLFRLNLMLRRRVQFSPVTQVALRLESQWRSVQAALILYVSYIIESTFEHHGTDYSFKLRWLHKD